MSGTAAEAPFRCPSSELNRDTAHQNDGTVFNRYFGDLRYNQSNEINSPKKISDIASPVETGVTADSTDEDAGYNKILPSDNAVGYRHNNGLNILWADGHVQWFTTVAIQAGQDGEQDWYYMTTKP